VTVRRHPLEGRTIVTTRDAPGRLDVLLAGLGARVLHVPLVAIGPADDGGAALAQHLDQLADYDWLVVTSRHGAAAVAPALADAPAGLRLGAVGTATAAVLAEAAGRPVDLVPEVQTAAALVGAFPDRDVRVLVAQADRAAPDLVEGLRGLGCHVDACTAYVTSLRIPPPHDLRDALGADAVAFASGSAAQAWAQAIGASTPPDVVVIGPTTERVARDAGLRVTAVADEHSVDGLVQAIVDRLGATP
jgi:uroporphyrinogen-III synthase